MKGINSELNDRELSLQKICSKFLQEFGIEQAIIQFPSEKIFRKSYSIDQNLSIKYQDESEFDSFQRGINLSPIEFALEDIQLRGKLYILCNNSLQINVPDDLSFYIEQIQLLYAKEVLAVSLAEKEDKLLNHLIEIDDLYNNSPVGYITLDYKGFIKKSNITFLDWVGHSRKKILSKNFLDEFVSLEYKEATQEFLTRIHLGKNLNDLEVEIIGTNGKKLTCMISGRSHFDREFLARLSIFDITEKAMVQSLYNEEVNKVIQQNTVQNRDLNIAAKIQKRLLPSRNLFPNIEYRYKPLDQLGGDFCDIFPFGDYIGIFISDVAGHGVPSAFVTAIMKSSLDKAESYVKEDPSQLLSYLNESIVDFCDGRFVTAFYGIYNRKTRELLFSAAGHPNPILVRGESVSELRMEKSGRPLGIFSASDKNSKFQNYINQIFYLEKSDRILFYTDGLVEASKIEKGNYIQYEDYLDESILRFKGLPLNEFLDKILMDQNLFLQGAPLEDDICMIGMDIE
ncbi:MAG: SpoIIE family protein phosphatase [Leptospira sp.]|nr:SpoIIE family protein phosphatase [Leptospira sp.]